MNVTGYTLLIVESPTLAVQLQKIVPQNVLVIPTEGFLWKPVFDPSQSRLGKKAEPHKLHLRKLIREEAAKAIRIIIATDSDPAGDFIAWSLSKELKHKELLRGNLQSLNKIAVEKLITNATPFNQYTLRKRLENRYIIRELWNQYFPQTNMKTAAAASLFGTAMPFTHFRTNSGHLLKSQEPVMCSFGSFIDNITPFDEIAYESELLLSTCSAIELITLNLHYDGFETAQKALYRLFETPNPHSGEGLITYPRTEANSLFRGSWDTIRQQWLQQNSLSSFIPPSLMKITNPERAHDSIRPVTLQADPAYVSKHIPASSADIYTLIYNQTVKAVSMPSVARSAYRSEKPEIIFTSRVKLPRKHPTLTPVFRLSECGHLLNQLGVLRPTGFGAYLDMAEQNKLIELTQKGDVKPGKHITTLIPEAERFKTILSSLKSVSDDLHMKPETISRILTS